MYKIVLMSIVVMTVVLPAAAARTPSPLLALRRAVAWMIAGIVVYVLAVSFVYPRLIG